jgi:hypothetical protein
MSKMSTLAAAIMLVTAPVTAQTRPAQSQETKPAETTQRAAEEPRRAASEPQPVNTRLELTITDSRGEGTPTTKTVSIVTADRYWGRIRTQGDVRTASGQRFPVILNVDARPTMLRENRARVELTIEYRPADDVTVTAIGQAVATPRRPDPDSMTPNINESLAVILEDGKSMMISQSADPVTDRKVRVEAKFTILR